MAGVERRGAERGAGIAAARGAGYGWLAAANLLWSGAYVSGKLALDEMSWVELNALRFTLATLLLAPVLWRGRHLLRGELAKPGSPLLLARLTLMGFVLNKAFEFAGLALTTASDVALLIATESLFTALLSWTLLREAVTRRGVAALCVGLAGAYLVVERGVAPNLGGPGGAGRVAGDVLVVLALLVEAGYSIGGKASLGRVPPLLLTSATIAGSVVVWLPAGAVAVARGGWPHVTTSGLLGVAYLVVCSTAMGYWMWFRGLARVDASAAAPFLFIQPLLGAALAVLLLRESLAGATVAGALLIALSLVLVAGGGRRERRAAAMAEATAEAAP